MWVAFGQDGGLTQGRAGRPGQLREPRSSCPRGRGKQAPVRRCETRRGRACGVGWGNQKRAAPPPAAPAPPADHNAQIPDPRSQIPVSACNLSPKTISHRRPHPTLPSAPPQTQTPRRLWTDLCPAPARPRPSPQGSGSPPPPPRRTPAAPPQGQTRAWVLVGSAGLSLPQTHTHVQGRGDPGGSSTEEKRSQAPPPAPSAPRPDDHGCSPCWHAKVALPGSEKGLRGRVLDPMVSPHQSTPPTQRPGALGLWGQGARARSGLRPGVPSWEGWAEAIWSPPQASSPLPAPYSAFQSNLFRSTGLGEGQDPGLPAPPKLPAPGQSPLGCRAPGTGSGQAQARTLGAHPVAAVSWTETHECLWLVPLGIRGCGLGGQRLGGSVRPSVAGVGVSPGAI